MQTKVHNRLRWVGIKNFIINCHFKREENIPVSLFKNHSKTLISQNCSSRNNVDNKKIEHTRLTTLLTKLRKLDTTSPLCSSGTGT